MRASPARRTSRRRWRGSARSARLVAVTLGAQGSLIVSDDGTLRPRLRVPVVDTTGCGDAYCAGFITALLDGRSLAEAAGLGTAAAALVAGGLGSDAGIVDLDQTLAFLKSQEPGVLDAGVLSGGRA